MGDGVMLTASSSRDGEQPYEQLQKPKTFALLLAPLS